MLIPNSIMTMYADKILIEKDQLTMNSDYQLEMLEILDPTVYMVKIITPKVIVIKLIPKKDYYVNFCEEANLWVILELSTNEVSLQKSRFLWL